MKNIFLGIALALTGMLAVSCSDDDDVVVVPELSSSEINLTFGNAKSTQEIKIKSTADFVAVTDVSWIVLAKKTFQAAENKIVIVMDENSSDEERVGHITVTSGDKKLVFTITQQGGNTFYLSQSEYYVPSAGGRLNLRIDANTEITITVEEGGDWLTYNEEESLQGKFPVLSFTATENDTEVERVAKVVVRKSTDEENAEGETITITQKEKDVFEVIDGVERTVAGNPTEDEKYVKFHVGKNIDFVELITFDEGVEPWIARFYAEATTGTKTVAEEEVIYKVDTNLGYDSRTATIALVNATTGEELSVLTITQEGNPTLTVKSFSTYTTKFDNLEIEAINKYYNITLDTNVKNLSVVSSDESWLTVEQNSVGYVAKCEANGTGAVREATITFTDEDGGAESVVLTIKQKAQ